MSRHYIDVHVVAKAESKPKKVEEPPKKKTPPPPPPVIKPKSPGKEKSGLWRQSNSPYLKPKVDAIKGKYYYLLFLIIETYQKWKKYDSDKYISSQFFSG